MVIGCTLATWLHMLRSVIVHVSLSAMLLHLAGGHCALHLPACEHHCHEHANQPAAPPVHDDCHESHSSAVVSQTVEPPSPSAAFGFVLPDGHAVASTSTPLSAAGFFCHADPTRPL